MTVKDLFYLRSQAARVVAFAVVLTVALAACGRRGASQGDLPIHSKDLANDPKMTGATTMTGLPYAAYNPNDQFDKMKQVAAVTDENKQFAGQIDSAEISQGVAGQAPGAASTPIEIKLRWQGLDQPLVFQGQLTFNKDAYYAELTENSGQRPDLRMTASCSDVSCGHAHIYLFDPNNRAAAISITKEQRVIRVAKPEDPLGDAVDAAKQLTGIKEEQPVQVVSTQIVPGKSTFEIRRIDKDGNVESKPEFKGALVKTDGSCPKVETSDPDFNSACLRGYDLEGNMLLKGRVKNKNQKQDQTQNQNQNQQQQQTQSQQPQQPQQQDTAATDDADSTDVNNVVYLELEPRASTLSAPSKATGQCPVKPLIDTPVMREIMKECTQPDVVQYIHKHWAADGTEPELMRAFLLLADGQARPKHQPTEVGDFKLMLQILGQSDLPQVMSFVTLIESNFTPKNLNTGKITASNKGALGFWQFMPATAKGLHLSIADTAKIKPSTQAFVKYFDDLLSFWDGDFKMALSSYNRGGGNLDSAANKIKERWKKDPNVPADVKEAYSIKKDFWYIYHYYMIHPQHDKSGNVIGSWDYVPDILAAIFTGVSPSAYGLTGAPAMEMK